MSSEDYRLSFHEARQLLTRRLVEPAPGRIQLLAGPRQVGKTTLLLEVAGQHGNAAIYAAADGPEAALPGFWERLWLARVRAAPPKLVTLNNALLAVMDPRGIPDRGTDPARFGAWVENACLAHAWSAGQRVSYWREEPLEVDAVIDGSWGSWVIEVKTGSFASGELRGIGEFVRRHPRYRPLVVCDEMARPVVERTGLESIAWTDFLLRGPPGPHAVASG